MPFPALGTWRSPAHLCKASPISAGASPHSPLRPARSLTEPREARPFSLLPVPTAPGAHQHCVFQQPGCAPRGRQYRTGLRTTGSAGGTMWVQIPALSPRPATSSSLCSSIFLIHGRAGEKPPAQTPGCVAYGHPRPSSCCLPPCRHPLSQPPLQLGVATGSLMASERERDVCCGRGVHGYIVPSEREGTGRDSLFPCPSCLLGMLCLRT